MGVPMYNFGVPVQLKTWIDAIARAGVTFRYTRTAPKGLVKGKKVYGAGPRRRLPRHPADSQVPYLKGVLGFLGMTDVESSTPKAWRWAPRPPTRPSPKPKPRSPWWPERPAWPRPPGDMPPAG